MYTFVHMLGTVHKLNFTEARSKFSDILDRVFLKDEVYIIYKGKIPVGQVNKVQDNMKKAETKTKKLDLSLFGTWKKDKRSALSIEKDLKNKAWARA